MCVGCGTAMTFLLVVTFIAGSIICYVWCFFAEGMASFRYRWESISRCLSFRLVTNWGRNAPETDENGDWREQNNVPNRCSLCGRSHEIWRYGGYIYEKEIAKICSEDITLPPAIRKRQVCLTCLVRLKGGRLAKKHHPSIRNVWTKSGWPFSVRAKIWFRALMKALWPFGKSQLRTYDAFRVPRTLFKLLVLGQFFSMIYCVGLFVLCGA